MNKLLGFLFISLSILGSIPKKETLNVHSFSEVEKLQKTTPKPVVVFVHADWCKICHGMEKSTFSNSKIIKTLNKSFYFIKLNGEEKRDITFLGKTFVFKPTGNNTGTHELAIELATIHKRVSYPTTTILDKNFAIVLQLEGLITKNSMLSILKKAKQL
ncbi:DUF255 domain-containing protein [Flavobacteriaceae bacterium S356]|uniref:DUF255 domain-containing protein n=1 Tax=Asprobacillus argus TaxID=3076534 RepID=A0ABU3LFY9_9FLAO|nr:DUF255 domain-containing protein [Flavobacteriaceae bacterium S356]